MSTGTGDALDFIERSLGALPRDPRRCSLEDLRTLAAVEQGFTRYVVALEEAMSQLEQDTRGDLDAASLHAALRQRADLHATEGRVKLAQKRLEAYTSRALAAHGIDINAAVSGGDNPRRR